MNPSSDTEPVVHILRVVGSVLDLPLVLDRKIRRETKRTKLRLFKDIYIILSHTYIYFILLCKQKKRGKKEAKNSNMLQVCTCFKNLQRKDRVFALAAQILCPELFREEENSLPWTMYHATEAASDLATHFVWSESASLI